MDDRLQRSDPGRDRDDSLRIDGRARPAADPRVAGARINPRVVSIGSAFVSLALAYAVTAHAEASIPLIRVGIAPEVSSATISAPGRWMVGIVGGRGGSEEISAGAEWTLRASGDQLVVVDHLGANRGGGADTLYFAPFSRKETMVRIDGRAYRGEFLVFASGGGRITVVNVIDLESYLRGVLPAEIGGGGVDRIEAVKAQ